MADSAAPNFFKAGCAIIPGLPAIARKRAVRAIRTRPFFTGTSFVYGQGAAIKFLAIEGAHCGLCLGVVVHGNEREPTRLAGHAVHHQLYFADLAVFFEKILEIVFSCFEGKIPYVQFHCDLLE